MKFGKSIFKTFFLSLCIIANTSFAYAQTAAILPPAKTTFLDQNGKPLTSGTVDFYVPSTTTRKTTWQDSAETIPNTNPVVLDSAGRAVVLGDGAYRQVVKDRNGNLIWDQVTSSAGSGGGGGGSTVGDGLSVGSVLPWSGLIPPSNYQLAYGQAISRTTFSSLLNAITYTTSITCTGGSATITNISDTSQLAVGAKLEASCLLAAGTVISKTSNSVTLNVTANVSLTTTSTFFPYGNGDGSTTFNVPDLRGYVIAGRCNMGGVDCSVLSTARFGNTDPNNTASALYAKGGTDSTVLGSANLPPQTPTGTITNGAITINGVASNNTPTLVSDVTPGSVQGSYGVASLSASQAASTFTGNAFAGQTSTPFSRVQPTETLNYIIKVTPDSSAASTNSVNSIGGMFGVLTCGSGILCSGQSISVNLSGAAVTSLGGMSGTLLCGNGITCSNQNVTTNYANIKNFGVKQDGISITSSLSITSGTGALTAVGASFVSTDVGKYIIVPGAGATSGYLVTTIATFTDATHVGLTANAGTTLTASSQNLQYGTDDSTAIASAVSAAIAGNFSLVITDGTIFHTASLNWGFNRLSVLAFGDNAKFQHVGSGIAHNFNGMTNYPGSQGAVASRFGTPGRIKLWGNPAKSAGVGLTTEGAHIDNWHFSIMSVAVHDANTTVVCRNTGVVGSSAVESRFDIRVSNNEDGAFAVVPTTGLDCTQPVASTFDHLTIEGTGLNTSSVAAILTGAVNNRFTGGTIESTAGTGITSDSGSSRNTYENLDIEANGTRDWDISEKYAVLINSSGAGTTLGNRFNTTGLMLLGGKYQSVTNNDNTLWSNGTEFLVACTNAGVQATFMNQLGGGLCPNIEGALTILQNKTINTQNGVTIKLGGNTLTAAVGSATLTFPNTTDTMVGRATVDTLTNKSIDASQITSTLPVNHGGTGATVNATVMQASPANPTGTTSLTAVMSGLGTTCVITTTTRTRIRFTIGGQIANNTANDGARYQLAFGTGAAPANGAAASGTVFGTGAVVVNPQAAAAYAVGFSTSGIAFGLAAATTYWFDIQLQAAVGGTATISNLGCNAEEL